jgi:hypothetical protein
MKKRKLKKLLREKDEEIQTLQERIRALVLEPNGAHAVLIRMEIKTARDIEKSFWAGTQWEIPDTHSSRVVPSK